MYRGTSTTDQVVGLTTPLCILKRGHQLNVLQLLRSYYVSYNETVLIRRPNRARCRNPLNFWAIKELFYERQSLGEGAKSVLFKRKGRLQIPKQCKVPWTSCKPIWLHVAKGRRRCFVFGVGDLFSEFLWRIWGT